jgi:hypothetical protein
VDFEVILTEGLEKQAENLEEPEFGPVKSLFIL